MKWVKGTEPVKINWHAGLQYDLDTRRARGRRKARGMAMFV